MAAEEILKGSNIFWTGVNDYTNNFFEGIWPVDKHGVSINSYVIKAGKNVLIDLVKAGGGGSSENILDQLESINISPEQIDYLILNHLEPDHTGFLENFRLICPNAEILTSKKGVPLIKEFYGITDKVRAVEDGEELDIGDGKKLVFYYIPNVHWPETMATYEVSTKVLFTCDAFGSFGALKGGLFDDTITEEDHEFFERESLRYYANIVGPFSNFVIKAIEKAGALDIKVIAPSHGIIWRKNPEKIIKRYIRYANYMNDYAEPKICVIWGSMYGNTETILRSILRGISKLGIPVEVMKVPETDVSYVLAEAWEAAGLVIAMPTYEYKMFPPMKYVLDIFNYKNVWHKKVVRVGSFGWSGGAAKQFVEHTKNLKWDIIGTLEYQGAPKEEDFKKAEELGEELAKQVKEIPSKK
ncbi:MAG: FprA family A-type flavoprotein [Promethearchaeota archaeon]